MEKEKVAICVISTNDNYVYKAIITLLSTKQHNQENTNFSYFVCGDLAEKYKKIVKKYGLEVMPMNLDNIFGSHKISFCPVNAVFWRCTIAEVFDNQGFKYSITLDGDIFCVNKIPFNEVKKIKQLALAQGKKLSDIINTYRADSKFFTNHKVIKKFNIKPQDFNRRWMNGGVIIFNNQNLVKNKLKQKFIKYYQDLVSITDFIGDEVIFMLLKINNKTNFDYLGGKWNSFLKSKKEDKIIFLHLIYKPWIYKIFWTEPIIDGPDYVSVEEYQQRRIKYQQLYISFAKKIYGYKFYIYYIKDLIPIIFVAKNIKKISKRLKLIIKKIIGFGAH